MNEENENEECSSQSAGYEENSEESDYDSGSPNSSDSMLDDGNDAVIGTASAGEADDRSISYDDLTIHDADFK